MPTDLHELLDDAAARAPLPDTEAIWQAGRRRARRRVAVAGVAGSLAVVLGVFAAAALVRGPSDLPDIGPVQIPGVDDTPTATAVPPSVEVATLVEDRTVLQRPDGSRQELPALAVHEAVMLRDGTFVYEASPPGATLAGDPPLWAVPARGEPILLDDATAEHGTRRLVGRDETGEMAMVQVEGGDLEVWSLDGGRVPVGGGTELATIPSNWLLSRYGFDLAFAMPGDRRVMVRSAGTPHDVDVTDHDGGVVDLAHTPNALVVLVTGGEPGPEIVVLDPASGEVRARHGVPTPTGVGTEVVGMAVTDGTLAVHRRTGDAGDDGWLPSALLDLVSGRWGETDMAGPAYLVGPPTPAMEGVRPGLPDGPATTTLEMDPEFEGGIVRALQRPGGTRQELPVGTTPVGGVMLADGTYMYEAIDPEGEAPPPGAAPPLWALSTGGDPELLDNARVGRRLVGESADGTAGLVLVDGSSLQRWSADGERVEVDSLAGMDVSSDLSVGMLARTEDGALAVQFGSTRVTVRRDVDVEPRQVAVTRADQTIRGVLAAGGRLVVVVDGDAEATPGEVVVLDGSTGGIAERIEIPAAARDGVRVGWASAHAEWVAVHLVDVFAGDQEWLPTELLGLRSREWLVPPMPGSEGRGGVAEPHAQ